MMLNYEKLFELDDLRTSLLNKGRVDDYKKTYLNNKKLPFVNTNTSQFWEEEFKPLESLNDPMSLDRINIVSSLIPSKIKSLLNVGVGLGNLEKIISSRNLNIKMYGIDITVEGLNRLKSINNFFPIVGALPDLPLNSRFNVITVMEVLEHLSYLQIHASLKELNRLLTNDGLLIVSVPINEDYNNNLNPNRHLRRYSKILIKAEIEDSGFEVLESYDLIAFNKFYSIKKFIAGNLLKNKWKPNVTILVAKKKKQ